MADIFLSYARKDKKLAEKLKNALESHGWQVWWDIRIRLGLDFVEVIQKEIRQADCVVVVWSVTSVKSNFVRDEAREALDDEKLVPVVIDGVRPPLGFRQVQTADLRDWFAGESSSEFDHFIESVRAALERQGPSNPSGPSVDSTQPASGVESVQPAKSLPNEAVFRQAFQLQIPGTQARAFLDVPTLAAKPLQLVNVSVSSTHAVTNATRTDASTVIESNGFFVRPVDHSPPAIALAPRARLRIIASRTAESADPIRVVVNVEVAEIDSSRSQALRVLTPVTTSLVKGTSFRQAYQLLIPGAQARAFLDVPLGAKALQLVNVSVFSTHAATSATRSDASTVIQSNGFFVRPVDHGPPEITFAPRATLRIVASRTAESADPIRVVVNVEVAEIE